MRRNGRILTAKYLYTQEEFSFHVDRLFGIERNMKDPREGSEDVWACVLVLRVVQSDKATFIAVDEDPKQVEQLWADADQCVFVSAALDDKPF